MFSLLTLAYKDREEYSDKLIIRARKESLDTRVVFGIIRKRNIMRENANTEVF